MAILLPRGQRKTPQLNYRDSPWMPRQPDYDGAAGRVIDPGDVMNALANPPRYASELTVGDLPGYIPVRPLPTQPAASWWDWIIPRAW
jgi:hypothetical protein